MKRTSLHTAIVAALAGYSVAGSVAWSQEGEGLEEIVVTATRREQNLQDVPLAVVAYTGEMLERQGIENMEDLKAVVPNLVVSGNLAGSNTASFTMRGIPNVGTYVDGIWQVSNNGLLLREFVELDRVEVLRGPQGTLYGRDSTGGAIRLYTKAPSTDYGVQVDMTVGNLDRRDVKGTLDLPITETFRTRFTVASYDRDGYITSKTTGIKTGAFEDDVLRADFIWEPTDRFSIRFNAQEDEITDTQARVNTFISNQIGFNSGYQMGLSLAYDLASGGRWNCNYTCSGYPGGQLDEWEGRQDITVPSRQWLEQQTVDLRFDISDNISFQYLAGHTFNDTRQYNDWDAGEFNFYIDYFNNEIDLTSHEFQFAGGGDRFSWVGGAYTWQQDGRSRNPAYSMADWVEANPPGQPGSYPNSVAEFSYNSQVIGRTLDAAGNPTSAPTSAACQMTPAQRGITSWEPHVAAGYVPPMVGPPGAQVPTVSLNVNSVTGWPYPCGFIPGPPFGPPFPADWVTALAGGARPPAGDRLNGDEIDGYALFGEVTIGLTERFDLTIGYRYHDQTADAFLFDVDAGVLAGVTAPKPPGPNMEFTGGNLYEGIVIPASMRSVSFDADTYRITGSWQFTDNVMLYLGYTEGFNSGGLAVYEDALGEVESQYNPETIENTELGIRSDLVDGRLRLNATYFDTDWVDIQLLSTVRDRITGAELTELILRNSAGANAEGVELEMTFQATDNLVLNANLGWLDTQYTETNTPAVTLNTEFSAAPDNTYDLGIQHTAMLGGGGSLVTRFDAIYTGAYWRSPTPSLRQNAYGVARDYESGDYWRYNAQLAYAPPDGRYELTLYGTNLTNEYELNSGFLHNIWQFDFATVDRPREVGVSMRMNF